MATHGPRYALGLLLIGFVAIIWVSASELIQHIYTQSNFDKPIFLTYFNTANFSLWLLGFGCVPRWKRMPWYSASGGGPYQAANQNDAADWVPSVTLAAEGAVLSGSDGDDDSRSREHSAVADTLQPPPCTEAACRAQPYAVRDVLSTAIFFAPLWCGANVAFNLSLSLTSVASNTILSNTSSMFVFLFGLLFLGQKFDAIKLLAVLLTITGASIVAFADGSAEANHSFYGDGLALVGAVLYGAYVSLLSKRVVDEENFPMSMFFGFVGLLVFLTMWPLFFLLHFTGIEPFELPSPHAFGFLLINSWVGTNLSDILWAQSVLLTSPLIATLGLSLTIPLAMVSDAVLQQNRLTVRYVCGALLVVLGFALVNTAEPLRAYFCKAAPAPDAEEDMCPCPAALEY